MWRIKTQPREGAAGQGGIAETGGRVLVAAMHGGAAVLDISWGGDGADDDDGPRLTGRKEFKEHGSMAYGADWIGRGMVGTCSFYDQLCCVWEG